MSKKMIDRIATLYVFFGPPGCGKTQKALQMVAEKIRGVHRVMITKDDLRLMLVNDYNPPANVNSIAHEMSFAMADIALAKGFDVILPNIHCYKGEIEKIVSYFGKKCNIEFVDCAEGLTLNEVLKRNSNREKKVPEDVVESFWKAYHILKKNRQLLTNIPLVGKPLFIGTAPVYNQSLPSCILCDVDNTLAMKSPDRSPFEWMKVELDTPNTPVIKHVNMWYDKGVKVFILSGRDAICAEMTKKWLNDNGVPFHNIFMRPENSGLADFTVKYMIYKKHIEGKYNVEVVYDDRQQVVDLWYWLGLPVFQVNRSCDDKPFDLSRLRNEANIEY